MATRAKKAKTKSRYRNKFKTEWSAELTSRPLELVTRTSAFIHYVILLHKYIDLPYKYFGIFFCESEIKSTLKMFIKKLCHRDKRGHRIAQIAAFAI